MGEGRRALGPLLLLAAAGCRPQPVRDPSALARGFFGPSRCAGARLQLCEDFESGAIDPAVWTVVGVPPTVDGQQAARGRRALHVRVGGNGPSYIVETRTFPAARDTYFGRMFVYFRALPRPAPGFDYAHWTFAAASGTGVEGEVRLSGQMQNGVNLFGVGTDSLDDPKGSGDWTNPDRDPGPNGTPTPVPIDRWSCIEWMHDGADQQTRFWWDGVEHPSLATTPATPHLGKAGVPFTLPAFTKLWVGWQEYQKTRQTFELWIDEVAVDGARIGCQT
jgi:hypothetical protein